MAQSLIANWLDYLLPPAPCCYIGSAGKHPGYASGTCSARFRGGGTDGQQGRGVNGEGVPASPPPNGE